MMVRAACLWIAFATGVLAAPNVLLLHSDAARIKPLAQGLELAGYSVTLSEDASLVNAAKLMSFHAVVLATDGVALERSNEKTLQYLVTKKAKGLVLVHGAYDCFFRSETYQSLAGADFKRFNRLAKSLAVKSAKHEAVKGVGDFTLSDAPYWQTDPDKASTVVQRVGDQPLSWVRHAGKGRVFVTALGGKSGDAWKHASFLLMLQQAVNWVCSPE